MPKAPSDALGVIAQVASPGGSAEDGQDLMFALQVRMLMATDNAPRHRRQRSLAVSNQTARRDGLTISGSAPPSTRPKPE